MEFSFIHTADIHLGRAFADIDYDLSPQQKDILNSAHEKALDELCNCAIDKGVDFILIAGDTFDDCEQDLHSRIVLSNSFKKLSEHGISIYAVCGNHDPETSYMQGLEFKNSDRIKIFGVNYPAVPTVVTAKNGQDAAIIHPFGFKTNEYNGSPCNVLNKSDNKALFNIGLIHCDVEGGANNIYAPCREKDLLELEYDYYALGHIHKPIIGDKIVYPGTLQGRNRKDEGAHGFCYIRVLNNSIISKEFITCDRVRYYNYEYSLTNDETEIETVENISEELSKLSLKCELIIVNLKLTGICSYKKFKITDLKQELSCWNIVISEIRDLSSIDCDIKTITSAGGIIGQIINTVEDIQTMQNLIEQTTRELAETLKLTELLTEDDMISAAPELVKNICREIYCSGDEQYE